MICVGCGASLTGAEEVLRCQDCGGWLVNEMKRGPHNGRYILDGHIPVPCEDLLTWARWIEDADQQRIVKQEYVGPFWVSTVFLGLDHSFLDDTPPALFETMVFRDPNDEDRREWTKRGWKSNCPPHISLDDAPGYRTSTWELALEQHAEAIAWVKERFN
jgi:hypothetical protein